MATVASVPLFQPPAVLISCSNLNPGSSIGPGLCAVWLHAHACFWVASFIFSIMAIVFSIIVTGFSLGLSNSQLDDILQIPGIRAIAGLPATCVILALSCLLLGTAPTCWALYGSAIGILAWAGGGAAVVVMFLTLFQARTTRFYGMQVTNANEQHQSQDKQMQRIVSLLEGKACSVWNCPSFSLLSCAPWLRASTHSAFLTCRTFITSTVVQVFLSEKPPRKLYTGRGQDVSLDVQSARASLHAAKLEQSHVTFQYVVDLCKISNKVRIELVD